MLLFLSSILYFIHDTYSNSFSSQVKSVIDNTYVDKLGDQVNGYYLEATSLSFSGENMYIQICLSVNDNSKNVYEKIFKLGNPKDANFLGQLNNTFMVLPNSDNLELSFSYKYTTIINSATSPYNNSKTTTIALNDIQKPKKVTIGADGNLDLTLEFKISKCTYFSPSEQFFTETNDKYFTKVSLDNRKYILMTVKEEFHVIDHGFAITEYNSNIYNDECIFDATNDIFELTISNIKYYYENVDKMATLFKVYYLSKNETTTKTQFLDKAVEVQKKDNQLINPEVYTVRFSYNDLENPTLLFELNQQNDEQSYLLSSDRIRELFDGKEMLINETQYAFTVRLQRLNSVNVFFEPTFLYRDDNYSVIVPSVLIDLNKTGFMEFHFPKNEKYYYVNLTHSDKSLEGYKLYLKLGNTNVVRFRVGSEDYYIPSSKSGDISVINWNTNLMGIIFTRQENDANEDIRIQYVIDNNDKNAKKQLNEEENEKKKDNAVLIGCCVTAGLVAIGLCIGIYCSVRKCKKDKERSASEA